MIMNPVLETHTSLQPIILNSELIITFDSGSAARHSDYIDIAWPEPPFVCVGINLLYE